MKTENVLYQAIFRSNYAQRIGDALDFGDYAEAGRLLAEAVAAEREQQAELAALVRSLERRP